MYVFVSLIYMPFFSGVGKTIPLVLADRLIHLFFSGIFAFLSGFLIDRDKKRQKQMDSDKYLANLGQVSTAIVHDLKNPLIVISGFAKRIKEGKENVDEAAQIIIESVNNMQKIVHDVLDFSKPIKLELKEDDLSIIVRKACDYCKSIANERGVTLFVALPDDPVYIQIDGFSMQRALINLINNSLEASKSKQTVKVSIETGKKYDIIRITDSGSGIDQKTLENIFTPFYTKKSGGTGFGIPIAKKIIEGHKGRIHIDSKVGEGTDIKIELPLMRRQG